MQAVASGAFWAEARDGDSAVLSDKYARQIADYERAWRWFVPEPVASVLVSTRVEDTGKDN
jgi:hypothetical protein